jgi:hypothetical protein
MSCGRYNKKVGVKEQFNKRDWADFKRRVSEYDCGKQSREANSRRGNLVVTPRVREEGV